MSAILGLIIGILLTIGVALAYVNRYKQKEFKKLREELSNKIDTEVLKTEVKRDQEMENMLASHVEQRVKAQLPSRKGWNVRMVSLRIEYDEEKEEPVWIAEYELEE